MSSSREYKLKTVIRALTVLLISGVLLLLLMAYQSSHADSVATAVSPDNIISLTEELKQGGGAQ